MAKRYTDTEKWKKPFIRKLHGTYKLLWLYILDECDHAGIWQVDLEVAEIRTGEKFKIEKALEQLNGKVHVFDNGEKWFIPSFIEFQYGSLNPENRVHASVLASLIKYSLVDEELKIKPLASPLGGATEAPMDKDKDNIIKIDKPKNFVKPTVEQVQEYFEKIGLKQDAQVFIDHYQSNGWKVGKNAMKDWQAACRTWKNRQPLNGKQQTIQPQTARVPDAVITDWSKVLKDEN